MNQVHILLFILSVNLQCAVQATGDITQEIGDSNTNHLNQIFADHWQYKMDTNPIFANSADPNIPITKLADVSLLALTQQSIFNQSILNRLESINYQQLDRVSQINYRIFKAQIDNSLALFKFADYQIPFTLDSGFYTSFARIPDRVPLQTVEDYQNYIQTLKSWPTQVDSQLSHMREGLKNGMTLPKELLTNIVSTVKPFLIKADESVFFQPFTKLPKHFSNKEKEQLINHSLDIINSHVIPGYRRLADFFEHEYSPGARRTLAASQLPNGKQYYKQRVRHFTTLELTVDEIHQLGLDEVARIRLEMAQIIKDLNFDGDFKTFIQFLRSDPQFYATSAEQLLKQASYIAKKMDAKLPSLFKSLPRLPYGVQAVPDSIAPTYTTGRYIPAPKDGVKPGYYWVNTYNLKKRPLYVLEALTFHEAVPGHHLQISLNNELENLPLFRQQSYISAFGEGWGLYSEWLGIEAGFYQDPYSNFGRLTYEMWRAVRLVVDTGIHAKGWSRQKARDYLASNTALSLHNVHTEIDRYISWPAQALSYKIGELKIKQLRNFAQTKLSDLFDIREFHEAVLGQGSVPLDVLEEQIQEYVEHKLSLSQ